MDSLLRAKGPNFLQNKAHHIEDDSEDTAPASVPWQGKSPPLGFREGQAVDGV